jgi:hypothetical protein
MYALLLHEGVPQWSPLAAEPACPARACARSRVCAHCGTRAEHACEAHSLHAHADRASRGRETEGAERCADVSAERNGLDLSRLDSAAAAASNVRDHPLSACAPHGTHQAWQLDVRARVHSADPAWQLRGSFGRGRMG